MVDFKNIKIFLSLTLSVCLLMTCSTGPTQTVDNGGSGTEITNGMLAGAIVGPDGTPSVNAQIYLLPDSFNAATSVTIPDSLIDTTDASGSYSFDNIRSGSYSLEAVNTTDGTRALAQNISISSTSNSITLPVDTLKQTGAIIIPLPSGAYSTSGYFYIPGTTHLVAISQSDLDAGSLVFDSLPSGDITSLKYVTTGTRPQSIDSNVVVPSNDSTIQHLLPLPWQGSNIGVDGVPGSAAFNNNVFTVAGVGRDIWDTADGFYFVYQPLSGNGEIIARVLSQEDTILFAKAGLMIRENLTTKSRMATIFFEKSPREILPTDTFYSKTAFFETRRDPGQSTPVISSTTDSTDTLDKILPYWAKLTRTGQIIEASVSIDGILWKSLGIDTIPNFGPAAYFGLAVTSHDIDKKNAINLAKFDNVSITIRY